VGDHPELLQAELAAVDPDAEHEVAVVELLGFEDGRLAAVDSGPALRVQPEPAEPPPQVGRVDRVETTLRVDVDDPLTDVEPVVVLLVLLVLVQRLTVTESPLSFAAWALVVAVRRAGRGAHGHVLFRVIGLSIGLRSGTRGDRRPLTSSSSVRA